MTHTARLTANGARLAQRIRELGFLRAVGMSRGQVRRMIRSEAVIFAAIVD